jgi:hypothetical protein
MKRSLFFVFLLLLVLVAASACDDMNRPAAVPHSEPRTSCFSDVECPGSKCVRTSANDIQGHCAASEASDGGTNATDAADAAPPVKPAPGDIQI